jgi:multiple sugar transport system substrate-binding protein
MKSDPPDDFKDFFPGMIDAITLDGKLYGIPIRSVVNVVHYNKGIFAERGISEPPKTMEEAVDLARKLTFTRANGEKVFGFSMQGAESVIYGTILALARGWNGDFIKPNYEVVIDQEPVVKAVTILKELHNEGVLPGNFNVMTVNDNYDLYKNNRAAMTIAPAPSYAVFNNPKSSLVAGKSDIITPPPAKAFLTTLPMAPPTTSFWLMVIPKGAQKKDLSWKFIKYLSSKESQVQMTFNGNGPTRASVFLDPRVTSKLDYARIASEASVYARPIWPPFDAQSEAQDILGKEAHKAIFAGKDPRQAMKDAAEGIRALVKDLK